MKSIADKLTEIEFDKDHPELFKEITSDDQKCLVDISKKLNTIIKTLGEDKMMGELMLQRAKVLDHFTMAYMAEMELKPSEVKLVQSVNEDGEIEIYFEKNSLILTPKDIQL